ncbi:MULTISPECIES: RlpA-like double-psi beta-barrel domain-containing protein [unclassified Xanthomonas]|uniref:RlpA-like double-psi beta-barrel domain-containing protein n=1 Tax=unclassified Xanthomonas TaxID=2643310 RepID=UPI002882EBD0|nr:MULTISPECIES: RlpA-like double-psi beta-barrel domain-containing protein [unclassified Xanthomonas]
MSCGSRPVLGRRPAPRRKCLDRGRSKDTGDSVVVRVNDRGPFHDGRVIDLSYVPFSRREKVPEGRMRVRCWRQR